MLDLEKVADRSRIDRSYDLRSALHTSRLRLMSHSSNKKHSDPPVTERVIEKHHHYETGGIDEDKLAAMMAKILQENQPTVVQPQPNVDSNEILQAMENLKKQIAAMGGETDGIDIPNISPEHWANLQSKAVEKLSENIESSQIKTRKKVILKNTKLDDLAGELGE